MHPGSRDEQREGAAAESRRADGAEWRGARSAP